MSITSAIQNIKDEMQKEGIKQEKGLGTELFHFASTLTPVVNVDLLITDANRRVLLSWRNDDYDETSWHVPGSCIRFQETLEEAIQRCARTEIGSCITYLDEPIKIYEFHWKRYRKHIKDQRERAHFITLVYPCRLPDGFEVDKDKFPPGKPGHLQWFDTMPEDILPMQYCYKNDWDQLKQRMMEESNHGME